MGREYRFGFAILGILAVALTYIGYQKLFRRPAPLAANPTSSQPAALSKPERRQDRDVVPAAAQLGPTAIKGSVVRALAIDDRSPGPQAEATPRQSFLPDLPQASFAAHGDQPAEQPQQSLDPGAVAAAPEHNQPVATQTETAAPPFPHVEPGIEVPLDQSHDLQGYTEDERRGRQMFGVGLNSEGAAKPADAHLEPSVETASTQPTDAMRPQPSAPRQIASRLKKRYPVKQASAEVREDRGATHRTYVVKTGDTLFDVAREELGAAIRWTELYELNHERLAGGIDSLEPGTQLLLPDRREIGSETATAPVASE